MQPAESARRHKVYFSLHFTCEIKKNGLIRTSDIARWCDDDVESVPRNCLKLKETYHIAPRHNNLNWRWYLRPFYTTEKCTKLENIVLTTQLNISINNLKDKNNDKNTVAILIAKGEWQTLALYKDLFFKSDDINFINISRGCIYHSQRAQRAVSLAGWGR